MPLALHLPSSLLVSGMRFHFRALVGGRVQKSTRSQLANPIDRNRADRFNRLRAAITSPICSGQVHLNLPTGNAHSEIGRCGRGGPLRSPLWGRFEAPPALAFGRCNSNSNANCRWLGDRSNKADVGIDCDRCRAMKTRARVSVSRRRNRTWSNETH